MTLIAPSLLSADFTKLKEEIISIEKSGADYLHLDIMDGHFVPNITFGPFIITQLRKLTKIPFDTHLMISEPGRYIRDFADAGSDFITVHAETENHLHRTLQSIISSGKKTGVSVNPHTDLSFLKYVGNLVDILLIMTVNPGFGGQSFIEKAGEKITDARKFREKYGFSYSISVDGGINRETAPRAVKSGADILVTGSCFFKTPEEKRKKLVNSLKKR